jgi:enoyl-CoA hydratase/carnithine racemase
MAKTSNEIRADQLQKMGIYNMVVDIPLSFPKREKTGDAGADKAAYQDALASHNEETGMILLPKVLEMATCPREEIPMVNEMEKATLATKEEIIREVERRKDPENYSHLWGQPLREAKGEIAEMGRPLAPQSIEALNRLLERYDPSSFDENVFVEEEMEADARLYRDPRFREGLISTLEQRVADYREAK